jgi:hypothetical protein
MNPHLAGIQAGMEKVAGNVIGAVADDVSAALRGLLDRDQAFGDDDVLSELLGAENNEDDRLEKLVVFLEEGYEVTLEDKHLKKVFEGATVRDLAKMLSSAVMEKSADFKRFKTHQRYYRHRHQAALKRRQYRMSHLHQERRRSKIYRRQVKRGARKPARRIGTSQSGYGFIGGYGSKVKHQAF